MNYKNPLKISSFSLPKALEAAASLSKKGVIHMKEQYCYLKIADDYIHQIFPILATHFQMKKPQYFAPPDDIGAHISIIYPEEEVIPNPQLKGQTHTFEITGLIKASYGHQIYYGFSVAAPTLAYIRNQQGLASNPTFKGSKIVFHITVGVSK